ncbi:type II toxin-antitoxin system VapC family toxin [Citricoccus sp. GCM10030269]|uniref:type II toxin-antitoxin system VapC family toxin n=1 Tax=Citricoccus sp. GCM10030269 TaxID=3273388 RepID=UPI003622EC3E
MAMPDAERAVLDTNVLLAATDESRPEHLEALAALNEWPSFGMALYTSGQIIREYLVVATRPAERNGLGLSRPDALANLRALRTRLKLLAEDAKVTDRLLHLLDDVDCTGQQIHDAQVVATMLVHGIDTIVTRNVDDFARFAGHVGVMGLRP